METFPIAAHAPTGAEPRHERVPPLRLNAKGHVIADRAAIAIRQDENKHDRRHDQAQHEEGSEDDGEYHGRTSENQILRRLPRLGVPREPYRLTATRVDAR
jgi:hypothetical protein